MSSSSRILLCMFLLFVTTSLLQTEATLEPSPIHDEGSPWGCDPGPCQIKCCACTVVRTRPVCAKCCEADDEKQPGGLQFSPKAAPIKLMLD
ncbi:hypothetical protein M0R45_010572 [Rubus argutus]|uniref:Uncharacterized protein n=1 Tax=Rubus argutus TaxID=59490 RepID=A0AAW1Y963_RUBAR